MSLVLYIDFNSYQSFHVIDVIVLLGCAECRELRPPHFPVWLAVPYTEEPEVRIN